MIHDCDATLRRKLEKTYLITGIASRVAATTLSAPPTRKRNLRRDTAAAVVRVDPGSFVAMTSPLFFGLLCYRIKIRNSKLEIRNKRNTQIKNRNPKPGTRYQTRQAPSLLSPAPAQRYEGDL